MNRALKHVAETLLADTGVARLISRFRSRRALILAYHNILPSGAVPSGDRSLHLPLDRFRAQLDILHDEADVVPLERLLDVLRARGDSARPQVAITFDDAYAGALRLGIPELQARGMPATVFVAPALLGGQTLWWDELLATGEGGYAKDGARSRLLNDLQGKTQRIHAWAEEMRVAARHIDDDMRTAHEQNLDFAVQSGGIALAAHSWSHPNMARLMPEELAVEVSRPLAWLHSRFQTAISWFAYPYGIVTPEVERAVQAAGYTAAVTISGGWADGHAAKPYRLPRLNVTSGLSLRGFRLRLAHVLGA